MIKPLLQGWDVRIGRRVSIQHTSYMPTGDCSFFLRFAWRGR